MGREKEKRFFFSEEEERQIMESIQRAEKATSGEIRVRLEHISGGDPYKRAVEVFEKLGMTATEQRNGILFYLATDEHQFTLIGDKGIHEKVSDSFWISVKDEVISEFKKGNFAAGLCNGIDHCGKALAEHFPYRSDDVNELSDEISKGDL
ncbi:MAG: TPM domain-containing protein [Bacteroidetes bacterium]|nr:MAG: TPM domain-containing protein [Bacteroidota bacterium]